MPLFCRTGNLGEEKNKEKNPSELVEGQEEGSFPQMLKGSQRKTKLTLRRDLLRHVARRWNERMDYENDELWGTATTPMVKQVSAKSSTFNMNASFTRKVGKHGGEKLRSLAPT